MAVIRFISKDLMGYGFDLAAGKVVSYKRNPRGAYMAVRGTYVLNFYDRKHNWLRDTAYLMAANATKTTDIKTQVANAMMKDTAVSGPLDHVVPDYPYVMYSVKNQCSQYFFAGTSVPEALRRFARRGEIISVDSIRVLNVLTGQVARLAQKVVTTYVLE